MADAELERELEALRREFSQKLPARLAALQALLRGTSSTAWEELERAIPRAPTWVGRAELIR